LKTGTHPVQAVAQAKATLRRCSKSSLEMNTSRLPTLLVVLSDKANAGLAGVSNPAKSANSEIITHKFWYESGKA
jgi:hypothetical protein